jgi:hypothetical protein
VSTFNPCRVIVGGRATGKTEAMAGWARTPSDTERVVLVEHAGEIGTFVGLGVAKDRVIPVSQLRTLRGRNVEVGVDDVGRVISGLSNLTYPNQLGLMTVYADEIVSYTYNHGRRFS